MKTSVFVATAIALVLTSHLLRSQQEGVGVSRVKVDSASLRNLRLTELFVIGEKAMEAPASSTIQVQPNGFALNEGAIVEGVLNLKNNSEVSVFSILDFRMRPDDWVIPLLEAKDYHVLLIADLCKNGEDTWQRVAVINRYSMEVVRSSLADSGAHLQTGSLRPFFVDDAVLTNNPFVREGDQPVVFFFKGGLYRKDLLEMQRSSGSLLSIDSQELYLISIGNAPQKYAAKEGDRIRIRLLRAENYVHRETRADTVADSSRADRSSSHPVVHNYATIVNVEDELYYTYREFGIKANVVSTIAWGSLASGKIDVGEFNPIEKNPSVGSNIFLEYEGRSSVKNILYNYVLPGVHLSLLGVRDPNGTKFTVGFVTSVFPSLRQYFGIFFGWHDLKYQSFGLTFSPSINFKVLVGAETAISK